MASYDRRRPLKQAAIVNEGPAIRAMDKLWDKLDDLGRELQDVAHQYDVAASYRGKPGERQAKRVLGALDAARRTLDTLVSDQFGDVLEAEQSFVRDNGQPDEYADRVRREIYPR
jgi:hypothetical protein